jgi:hypothetical protein
MRSLAGAAITLVIGDTTSSYDGSSERCFQSKPRPHAGSPLVLTSKRKKLATFGRKFTWKSVGTLPSLPLRASASSSCASCCKLSSALLQSRSSGPTDQVGFVARAAELIFSHNNRHNKQTHTTDKRRAFFEFDHFRFRRWVLAVGGWVALVP